MREAHGIRTTGTRRVCGQGGLGALDLVTMKRLSSHWRALVGSNVIRFALQSHLFYLHMEPDLGGQLIQGELLGTMRFPHWG